MLVVFSNQYTHCVPVVFNNQFLVGGGVGETLIHSLCQLPGVNIVPWPISRYQHVALNVALRSYVQLTILQDFHSADTLDINKLKNINNSKL